MTVKLMALYRAPEDEAAFNHYYDTVHTPLVKKIPGLQSLTVNRVQKHLMGDTKLYMIVEMAYADHDAFTHAMASAENKATGKDIMNFAKDLVSVMVTEG
jgi:uncharacterized protein (TIGR02118 family)